MRTRYFGCSICVREKTEGVFSQVAQGKFSVDDTFNNAGNYLSFKTLIEKRM